MNTAVWIIQGLLGAFFLIPAFTKLFLSPEKLAEKGMLEAGANPMPVRMIGVLELLGAVGIVIPWLTGIMPVLTPLAAVGLSLIMVGAAAVHIRKKDYKMIPMLVVIFLFSATVAAYRLNALTA